MILKFRGMCSGTEVRNSPKSGKDYQVTKFVELPSMNVLTVFGDLGLSLSAEPQDWEFECSVENASRVKVVAGGLRSKNAPVK